MNTNNGMVFSFSFSDIEWVNKFLATHGGSFPTLSELERAATLYIYLMDSQPLESILYFG